MTDPKTDLVSFLELMCGITLADWQKDLVRQWETGEMIDVTKRNPATKTVAGTKADMTVADDPEPAPKPQRLDFAKMTQVQLQAHFADTLGAAMLEKVTDACKMVYHVGGPTGLAREWTEAHWPAASAMRNQLYRNKLAIKNNDGRLLLTNTAKTLIGEP